MKSNAKFKTVRKYVLWITHPNCDGYISSNIFDTPTEAMKMFKGMADYCRARGDESGARDWQVRRAEAIAVDIRVPIKETGGAA